MLRAILDTLKRYMQVSRWLCRDVARAFGGQMILSLSARLSGVACFVGAISIVTVYARWLESDRVIEALGRTIEPRESVLLLALIGVAALLAMVAGAALTYFANRSALLLRRDYEVYCGYRVLSIARRALRIWSPAEADATPERFLATLAKRDSRYCGRVAADLVVAVIPSAIVLLVAIPALAYMNPWLTIIVAVIVGISAVQHYRLSVQTARLSLERESHVAGASRVFQRIIAESGHQHAPRHEDEMNDRLDEEPVKRYLQSEIEFRVASHRSRFFNDLAMGIAMMIVLIVLGSTIILRGTGWSTLLVYLVAMRYSMTQMRTLMSAVTKSNRFYHQLRRYFLFIENTPLAGQVPQSDPPADIRICVSGEQILEGSLETMRVKPGDRAAVLTTIPLNRYTVPQMLSMLLATKVGQRRVEAMLLHAAVLTRHTPLTPHDSLCRAIGLGEKDGIDLLQSPLAACGLWDRVRAFFPADAELPIDGPVPEEVDDELGVALLLLAAATRGFRIIMVDAMALEAIEADRRHVLLEQVQESIVLIVGRNSEFVGDASETAVAVLGDEGVIGMGALEWLEQHREEIDTILDSRAHHDEPTMIAVGESDDDL